MMFISTFDKNVKVRSLTVREFADFAISDLEKEDPIKIINQLVVKCSSLPAIQNNIIGLLLIDVFKCSNIDMDEDIKEMLKRISSLASTYPNIFNDNNDRPELRKEIKELYVKLADSIQPDIQSILIDKAKLIKLGIQPSEIDQLPYWEFKEYIRLIK